MLIKKRAFTLIEILIVIIVIGIIGGTVSMIYSNYVTETEKIKTVSFANKLKKMMQNKLQENFDIVQKNIAQDGNVAPTPVGATLPFTTIVSVNNAGKYSYTDNWNLELNNIDENNILAHTYIVPIQRTFNMENNLTVPYKEYHVFTTGAIFNLMYQAQMIANPGNINAKKDLDKILTNIIYKPVVGATPLEYKYQPDQLISSFNAIMTANPTAYILPLKKQILDEIGNIQYFVIDNKEQTRQYVTNKIETTKMVGENIRNWTYGQYLTKIKLNAGEYLPNNYNYFITTKFDIIDPMAGESVPCNGAGDIIKRVIHDTQINLPVTEHLNGIPQQIDLSTISIAGFNKLRSDENLYFYNFDAKDITNNIMPNPCSTTHDNTIFKAKLKYEFFWNTIDDNYKYKYYISPKFIE